MNAVARTQLTFQMLTLLKKYLCYDLDASANNFLVKDNLAIQENQCDLAVKEISFCHANKAIFG